MGDRGNIVVKQGRDNPPVWLYTHWSGCDMPLLLQNALKRKQRWDDNSYLTRIIFCALIQGDTEGETGYGISTIENDNEHHYLVVDPDEGTVAVIEYHYARESKEPLSGKVLARWTMTEYIELPITKKTTPEDLPKLKKGKGKKSPDDESMFEVEE